MKIAQRFNAGWTATNSQVPKGQMRAAPKFNLSFGRPFGTRIWLATKPSVETLGYCRRSLRDEHKLACVEFPNGIITNSNIKMAVVSSEKTLEHRTQ